MLVRIATNLSTVHWPAPKGEGPYLAGEEREVEDAEAKKMIAAKLAVDVATLPPPAEPKPAKGTLKPGEIPPAPHSAASTVTAQPAKSEPTKPSDKPGK